MSSRVSGSRNAATTQSRVNLRDLKYAVSQSRTNFTTVRGKKPSQQDPHSKIDFITFISLACEIYRNLGDELAHIQQYPSSLETYQGKGHTSLVGRTDVSIISPASFASGSVSSYRERVVIKRPRQRILEENSSSLTSFITELRVRSHPPLRSHPNISRLRGIGWDFEDEDATMPRPILLEEFAPQGSLDSFWKNWGFVRLNFVSKLQFCKDIAEGLKALHHCGVVHGDVKPENILVFPRKDVRNSFMLKITDFGHSVLKHDAIKALPAFTQHWCAPEVQHRLEMTFEEMVLTDHYSFGLVVLSVMIGRPFYEDFDEVEEHKSGDRMLIDATELLDKVDRENNGLDIDIDFVELVLRRTLQLNPEIRNLGDCISIIDEYIIATEEPNLSLPNKTSLHQPFSEIPQLSVINEVIIGHQTLSRASYQLKNHIVNQLLEICNDPKDCRKPSAAWELSLCYFVGFGTPSSFEECSRWLLSAAENGVIAAQNYFHTLHQAMNLEEPATSGHCGNNSAIKTPCYQSGKEAPTNFIVAGGCRSPLFDKNKNTACTSTEISAEVNFTIVNGSLSEISTLLNDSPALSNCQTPCGDTPMLIAAKSGRFEIIDMMLKRPSVDASISNNAGQTVLHFLSNFDTPQVRILVPQLIAANADLNAQGLSTAQISDSTFLDLSIRSCSFLNAVLHNRSDILDSLLKAIHSKDSSCSLCTICKGGSRFRRILAVTLSLFSADALDIISTHIKEFQGEKGLNLRNIEVWSGLGLFPIYQIPFRSVVVTALDIPDSVFRALYHGRHHLNSLKRCIYFLLDLETDGHSILFAMLDAAVDQNSVDGVRLLLQAGKERGAPTPEWWLTKDISDSPIFKSIRYGLRDIFDIFLEHHLFFRYILTQECNENCRNHKSNFRLWMESLASSMFAYQFAKCKSRTKMFRIGLEAAVSARAQDTYFIKHILDTSDLNEAIHGDILTKAISQSYFNTAKLLSAHSPSLWTAITDLGSYPVLDHNFVRKDGSVVIGGTGLSTKYFPSVIEQVLFHGSYDQCRFVLQEVQSLRDSKRSASTFKGILNPTSPERRTKEDGYPDWYRCNLKPQEYHALVVGSISRYRRERQALWEIIKSQAAIGHSLSPKYLHAAIRVYNTHATYELLESGWNPNSPYGVHARSPLQLVQNLLTHVPKGGLPKALIDELEEDGPVGINSLPNLGTHYDVYEHYFRLSQKILEEYRLLKLNQCEKILRERGAKSNLSFYTVYTSLAKLRKLAWLIYFLFLLCLPFIINATTHVVWKSMDPQHKYAFLYIWVIVTLSVPSLKFVLDGPPHHRSLFGIRGSWVWYGGCMSAALLNHFVIPIPIIRYNWQPLLACKPAIQENLHCYDYSFLFPLIVGGLEIFLGSIFFSFGEKIGLWEE